MRLYTIAFTTLAIATGLTTQTMADITRGCRGYIQISTELAGSARLAELDTTGWCPTGRPNLCRDRAANRIRSCADALVDGMGLHNFPEACQSLRISDTTVNWFYWGGVSESPFPNGPWSGRDRVARHACCNPQVQSGIVNVIFSGTATGGPGCYATSSGFFTEFVGNPDVDIDCTAAVAAGICGPVGPAEAPASSEPTRTTPPASPTRTNPPAPPPRTNPTPPRAPELTGGESGLRLE